MKPGATRSAGISAETVQLLAMILIFAILTAGCLFLFRLQIIIGTSMEPTLEQGSVVVCMRTFSVPRQQDVVLFRSPDGTYLLKRVIALGGQTVQVDNSTGEVWIDAEVYTDAFCAPRDLDYAQEAWPGGYTGKALQIPKGYLFCMGDNRANSLDSRDAQVGLVPIQAVWGKLIYPGGA